VSCLGFITAFSIRRKVEHAVVRYRFRRATPPVAGPAEIDARLDALFSELLALTAPGRERTNLDESVARACARIEEWTA
jgi:hypothetical protein